MPQFDFTKFSSQIFWFSICFAVLYYFVCKIILPRIHAIIGDRKTIIDADLSEADAIEERLREIQIKTADLRRRASTEYQTKLDLAIKHSAKERERVLTELKNKIDDMIQKSNREIRDFVDGSNARNGSAISDLVKQISAKIFD